MPEQDVTFLAPVSVTERQGQRGSYWLLEDREGRSASTWSREIADHLAAADGEVVVTMRTTERDGRTFRNVIGIPGVVEPQRGGGGNRDVLEAILAELRAIRAVISGAAAPAPQDEVAEPPPAVEAEPTGDACPSCGAAWGTATTSSGKRICERGHVERVAG